MKYMHLGRKITAAILVICALATGFAQAASVKWMDEYALKVAEEVNLERSRRGLSELELSRELCEAAEQRAREIVKKFSHTRPDGRKWNTISSRAYGENIARGQRSVDRVMAAWMSSSGHRKNILRAGYGSIGVACVRVNSICYWVQLFGK